MKNRGTNQIVIPDQERLRQQVFYWSHSHPSEGHFGKNATNVWASLKFYWPDIFSYLKRQVKTCNGCLTKIHKVNNHESVHQPSRHGFPNKVLYVDLVGPLLENSKGDGFVLTMQDGFSKYACTHPIPCKEAEVVANQLNASWLTKLGCPVTLHRKQGTDFENKI